MKENIANKILKHYKNKDFKSFIILGERGYGMNTYHLKLMEQLYIKKYIEGR